jgi:DNA-binding GntR family transcriptional regulator
VGNKSPRDTYRQVADTLRAEIKNSPAAETPVRLGTETELSLRFGVARNTLRKALSGLAQDGLVYSVPTKGWFIGSVTSVVSSPDQTSIAADLAREIKSGHPGPGEKLATAPQIASRYGVTLHVARQALIALGAQGLIESQHGRGWYVRSLGV